MPQTEVGFIPAINPKEMLNDPQTARSILRHALDWLAGNTADLSPQQQSTLARQVGAQCGLYAAEYPVEYGGWALSERLLADLREDAAASGMWFSRFLLSNFHGPARILLEATPQQRDWWLRPLVEGRWTRCLAMTEELSGSDLSSLQTTASQSDGQWLLRGRKIMIGNAANADLAIVLANVVGDGPAGPTFFAFTTDTVGWRVGERMPGMDPNYHAFHVELDSIALPDSAIIGGPGQIGGAIGQATEHMAHGRLVMAARAVGLSRWALTVARRHAATRRMAGGRLDDKQYVREFLVRSDVKITAARALVREAADALDKGQVGVREAAVAKLFATESACEVIDDAMQVLGARGWLSEYGLEQIYRESRAFRIADGASEVLKETIFHLPAELAG